jgi:glyoxylase-like metal-dependent hydrolase (beta-lactamase superfamily II)
MIRIEQHGDVRRLVLTSWRSRVIGYSVSAYLVRGVMIDSGFPSVGAELESFWRSERPRGVMITHKHEDHAGNVHRAARLGLSIAMAAETEAEVRDPHQIGFYRRWTWSEMPPLRLTVIPFEPEDLQMVATPGHCADHHVVWDPNERTLFSGDLFLGVKVRIAHPGENPRQLAQSVRAAAALEPKRLFDGHRGPIPTPVAALRAKADWLDQTIGRIDERIREGWPDAPIMREVLGREEFAGYFSRGDYSRGNFVRAVRRTGSALGDGDPSLRSG